MTVTIENVELPALIGIKDDPQNIQLIRSLTDKEKVELEKVRNVYYTVSPIMTIFGALYWNYNDIKKFTNSGGDALEGIPPLLNANRLIINYIVTADALLEHFSRIYKKQCRTKKIEDTGFKDLLKRLESEDDNFEFFSRFRNHITHVGLPVGSFTVSTSNAEESKRVCSITHRSNELKFKERDYKTCRLLQKKETIDIILHLKGYHNLMMNRVFKEIVSCFMTDLQEANTLHEAIVQEVHSYGTEYRPCVLTARSYDGPKFNLSFDMFPMDLVSELGIQIKEKV